MIEYTEAKLKSMTMAELMSDYQLVCTLTFSRFLDGRPNTCWEDAKNALYEEVKSRAESAMGVAL